MSVDFSRREEMPELMDLPDCDEARLLRTVAQFKWINAVAARYRTILRRYVLAEMRADREYRLVDLGAGGCDIAAWLLGEAARRGLKLRVTAIDADPRIVRFARSRYGGLAGLEIREHNAFDLERLGPTDFLFSNQVLHHLPDAKVAELLAVAGRVTQRVAVFSDLERGATAYWGYWVAATIFLHRSFARYDGLLSVRKGFRAEELQALLTRAGQQGTVRKFWPERLVVVMPARGNTKIL
jgi:2-polyprenyl-3-methyl-5-hydroxy-6-metoxy-1,4-benzoquinol methylase